MLFLDTVTGLSMHPLARSDEEELINPNSLLCAQIPCFAWPCVRGAAAGGVVT
jgi:hypothetical protein